jgi:hypothetical protein
MEFDRAKFAELLLYVADRSTDDHDFGATKLNKILFFSDFLAYAERGEPITGAIYQKLDHGPAPKALLPVQEELIRDQAATIVPKARYNFTQKRLTALRQPNLEFFSAEEISLVEQVIQALDGANASDVSRFTHEWPCWQLTEIGEDIPYFTVYLFPPALPAAAVEFGVKLAALHGLAA